MDTSSTNSIVPDISAYRDFQDFLAKKTVKKDHTDKKVITNTRIGDKTKSIFGGSYNIQDAEYPTFLKLYYRDVIRKKGKEYLTEKQRDSDGPIAIDLDFRYSYNVDEKQHTSELIDDIVSEYLNVIKTIYQFDESSKFYAFVLEKPSVNRVSDKNITKDGIHIIFKIQMERNLQLYVRKQMMKIAKDLFENLPLTNSMDEIFDEGITRGSVNWQLFGSRKPGYDKYGLTRIFEITYDPADEELCMNEKNVSSFDIEKNLTKLSIRDNKGSLSLFMKNSFITEFEKFKRENNLNERIAIPSSTTLQHHVRNEIMLDDINVIASIRNHEELELAINSFIDSTTDADNQSDYILKNMYDYTMILPSLFYGTGSYDKWIRVGWALRSISNKMLIVWIAFSAQADSFQFSEISDMCDKWKGFDKNGGLTKLSLIHWAKNYAKEEFERVRKASVDYYAEITISPTNNKYRAPDYDLATVLYQLQKHNYVCVSNKSNIWYAYIQNQWKENDSGVGLRRTISGGIRDLYKAKSVHLLQNNASNNQGILRGENGEEREEINKNRSLQILAILQRLGQSADKTKIMTEAKELFYDGTFLNKLDTNPYLLCFNNGVIDFKTKEFRPGQPEDYISMCTNIDYIKLTDEHKSTVKEINNFMKQLFPEPALCKYMWEHLASTLIGTSANQTFNMYYGNGQNGKSVLVNLMEKVLGDYKVDVPLSLVTERRGKAGAASPELALLKGKRFAVMQEPSKRDALNEGIMKQLTSGKDAIQARQLYAADMVSYIPQFKLVVTCNNLMVINSNDHGTWRRIRTVPFKSLFTENPVEGDKEKPYQFALDPYIDEKFTQWAPVFCSMLVDIVFKTNGVVKDCQIVTSKSNEYRQSQDYISEYIRDRISRDDEGRIKKMELNNDFSIWYASNYGGRGPSPKDLHEYMDKEYGRARNQAWHGIRIKYEDADDDEEEDNEEFNDDININDT